MLLGSLMETVLSVTRVGGRSAGCRPNLKWIAQSSWTTGDNLGCWQMLRVRFVCTSCKCKMTYLDFQKCVDKLVSHLLDCCLFFFPSSSFFNIVLGKYLNQFMYKMNPLRADLHLSGLLKAYFLQVQLFLSQRTIKMCQPIKNKAVFWK